MISQERKCKLIGEVLSYVGNDPGAVEKLEAAMENGYWLLTTEDVAVKTGWSTGHIIRLCKQGLLPFIPGNPHKFVPKALVLALEQLQVGGVYGRRKSTKKPTLKRRPAA